MDAVIWSRSMIAKGIHDYDYVLRECGESSSRIFSIGLTLDYHSKGVTLLAMDDEGLFSKRHIALIPIARLPRSPIARLEMTWEQLYSLSAQELADKHKGLVDEAVSVRDQCNRLDSYALRGKPAKRVTRQTQADV